MHFATVRRNFFCMFTGGIAQESLRLSGPNASLPPRKTQSASARKTSGPQRDFALEFQFLQSRKSTSRYGRNWRGMTWVPLPHRLIGKGRHGSGENPGLFHRSMTCSRISARQRLRQSTRSAILTNPLDRLFHDGKADIMGEAQRADDGL